MTQDVTVKKQITIQATSAEVWEALTNPELTKKYFFKCEVHSDWKEGSPISFKRSFFFFTFTLKGEIKKIEPEKLLQYTLRNTKMFGEPDPDNYSLVTDELSFQDGKTILSITDNVGSAPGAEKRYEKSVKGWGSILQGLKELLEKKK